MNALKRLSAANPEVEPALHIPFLDERARHDLARILDLPPRAASVDTVPGNAARRRFGRPAVRLTAVGAACLVLAVVVLMSFFRPWGAPAARAVTPEPLTIVPSSLTTAEAFSSLIRAAEQGREPLAPERRASWSDWSLWTRVDDQLIQSAVVPLDHDNRWFPDGSGHRTARWGTPWVPQGISAELPVSPGEVETDEAIPPGRFAPDGWADPPPAQAAALLPYLARGHPIREQGTPELMVAIADLQRLWHLGPPQVSAALTLLRDTGDLRFLGTTKDRLGRAGWAFSMDHDHGGLPVRTTLIISPQSGRIMAEEEMLTTSAGRLNVAIPAVISYTCFR